MSNYSVLEIHTDIFFIFNSRIKSIIIAGFQRYVLRTPSPGTTICTQYKYWYCAGIELVAHKAADIRSTSAPYCVLHS